MLISDAQRESRTVYVGGSIGQLVSALIWFASAVVATVVGPIAGFWALALGGATIFPLTQGILRLAGRKASLSQQNPLRFLAMEIAFTVPLVVPVAAAASLHERGWFYPGCMIIVGAHYLPFVFLYGMNTFALLAVSLIGAGFAIGLVAPEKIVMGGWVGGAILFVFAFALLVAFQKGSRANPSISVPASTP
jgi:uncharacterized protein DUF7010